MNVLDTSLILYVRLGHHLTDLTIMLKMWCLSMLRVLNFCHKSVFTLIKNQRRKQNSFDYCFAATEYEKHIKLFFIKPKDFQCAFWKHCTGRSGLPPFAANGIVSTIELLSVESRRMRVALVL